MKIPKNLDWNLLKSLNICSRHKNFYEAALEAGVLAPAFSKQLKKLEHQIGFDLFERVNGNAFNRLTPAGFELLKKTLYFEGTLSQNSDDTFNQEQAIHIYTTHGVASIILPSIIDNFLKEFGKIKVHIITNESPNQLNSEALLIRADIQTTKMKDIEKIKLTDIVTNFYASKNYIENKGHPKKFLDLKNHDLLFSFGNKAVENLAGNNLFFSPLCTSTDINFSYSMCLRGYGILELPSIYEGTENLVHVLEEETSNYETLYIWCANKMIRSSSISSFIKTIKKLFKD